MVLLFTPSFGRPVFSLPCSLSVVLVVVVLVVHFCLLALFFCRVFCFLVSVFFFFSCYFLRFSVLFLVVLFSVGCRQVFVKNGDMVRIVVSHELL